MPYIELAIGSPRKRGLLIPLDNLPDIIAVEGQQQAVYRSVYTYYDDAIEYQKIHRSLREFMGLRGLDLIPIDIDKGTDSHDYTLQRTQGCVLNLYELGLSDENFHIFFSGTGYHIVLHADVFHLSPSKDMPFVLKETMKNILDDIDCSIYNRTGIYRVEHSLNNKKGYYKIPLTSKELFNLSAQDIHLIATDRRIDFQYNEIYGEGELEDHVIKHIPRIRTLQATAEPKDIVPCVQKLFANGPVQGKRNNTILRLASHFARHGFPSEIAKAGILHWNFNTLDENVVTKIIEDVYNRGYKYGCNDFILKDLCNPRCKYYRNKDYLVEVKTASQMQKSLEERMTTDYQGRCLHLDKLFGLVDKEVIVYPGELITIFGPTGANKTTLAQNIVLGYDAYNDMIRPELQIPTLYLSLELTDWYTHKRNLQIVSDLSKADINRNYKEIFHHHKDKVNHIAVQTVSPTVDKIREMIVNLQPKCVVVDYIDLIEPPRHIKGEYETIRYISHSLSALAVQMDIVIIQLSQTSREYSRSEVLDLYAGKGSGAIENASRKVIGIGGNAQNITRKVELFKNTDGELFSVELEWTPSFRLKRLDKVNTGTFKGRIGTTFTNSKET